MFLFQLIDKIEDYEIEVRWYTRGKRRHSIKALPWNLPWYLYFKKVIFLDKYFDEENEGYWLCEVK